MGQRLEDLDTRVGRGVLEWWRTRRVTRLSLEHPGSVAAIYGVDLLMVAVFGAIAMPPAPAALVVLWWVLVIPWPVLHLHTAAVVAADMAEEPGGFSGWWFLVALFVGPVGIAVWVALRLPEWRGREAETRS